jgi:ethanolamine ammonia-lyase small subunit
MTGSDVERLRATPPDLRRLTQARVLLGRHGAGLPTRAAQSFLLDHVRARQAVWSELDRKALRKELADLPLDVVEAESMAADRSIYVRRPDLGRLLSVESPHRLEAVSRGSDVVIVVGDGLSASAVAINAAPLVHAIYERLSERGLSLAPVILAAQARVALADPIGELLRAQISIMLIGERPGLSAADSLGAYITFAPKTGTPDSRRNCVSNIRNGGLSINEAAEAVVALVTEMLSTGISGVGLKDAVIKASNEIALASETNRIARG